MAAPAIRKLGARREREKPCPRHSLILGGDASHAQALPGLRGPWHEGDVAPGLGDPMAQHSVAGAWTGGRGEEESITRGRSARGRMCSRSPGARGGRSAVSAPLLCPDSISD